MAALEQFTKVCTTHGEGPFWDARAQVLRCVDMTAGDVLSVHPETGAVDRRTVGEFAACVRPRRDGGLVVAVGRGFVLLDPDGQLRVLPPAWDDPTVRMNEGACDPAGRFWCGSMDDGAAPGRGTLYRLDPDGTVSAELSGVSVSNGLSFAPDGSWAYYADSGEGRVDVLEFDAGAGTVTGRRPLITVEPSAGVPDGLCVDAEGGIWLALYDGGAVRRYDPDGTLSEVIEVPAPHVTACSFGGPDRDQLFITTSRRDAGANATPGAGAIFRARPGVRGREEPLFAG
jgi:sugar lactone lactonase YvrE